MSAIKNLIDKATETPLLVKGFNNKEILTTLFEIFISNANDDGISTMLVENKVPLSCLELLVKYIKQTDKYQLLCLADIPTFGEKISNLLYDNTNFYTHTRVVIELVNSDFLKIELPRLMIKAIEAKNLDLMKFILDKREDNEIFNIIKLSLFDTRVVPDCREIYVYLLTKFEHECVGFPKFEDVVKEYQIESSYVKVTTSWDEQVIWLIDNVNVPDAHFSDNYDCSNSPEVFIHALSKPYVAEYLYTNARDKENILSYCYDLIDFMDDVTRKNYVNFITKCVA